MPCRYTIFSKEIIFPLKILFNVYFFVSICIFIIKTNIMKKKTQEEFETDVITLYGDRYDLSESVYRGNKIKLKVKCNLCGTVFDVRPNDLLSGHGCKCLNRGWYDGKYYKQKFQEIHGDKYDYSLLIDDKIYSQEDYVDIICKKHGVFHQKIKGHLSGRGCRTCASEKNVLAKRLDKYGAMKRIEILYPNKFSYDVDEYIDTQHKITLTCKTCGKIFRRKYNNLLNNGTCPYCNGTREEWSTEWFIKKAKEIHGDKYDYSQSIYEKTDKKVIVICHEKDKFGFEHGPFEVTPHAHIGTMKSGCPKCSGKHKYTTEEFIREANYIHNNFYDYSKTIYNGAFKKVIITCPIHGDFQQKPNSHLSGQGCPHCKSSKIENEIDTFLTDKNIKHERQYSPKWLKTQKTSKQTLDFYLQEYNIAIEVQGDQHFRPVKYWGGEENFQKVITRDKRKKELCEKNGVYLIYYSECKNIPEKFLGDLITNKQELLTKILNKNDQK